MWSPKNNTAAQNNTVAQNNDTENENDLDNWRPQGHAPTVKTIGDRMHAFKSITTVEFIQGVKTWGWQTFDGKWWQRNYYEHIIRNEQSYQKARPAKGVKGFLYFRFYAPCRGALLEH